MKRELVRSVGKVIARAVFQRKEKSVRVAKIISVTAATKQGCAKNARTAFVPNVLRRI